MDPSSLDIGLGAGDLDHLQLAFDSDVSTEAGTTLLPNLLPQGGPFDSSTACGEPLLTDVSFSKDISLMQSPTIDLADTFSDNTSIFGSEPHDLTFSTTLTTDAGQASISWPTLNSQCEPFHGLNLPDSNSSSCMMSGFGPTLKTPPIFTETSTLSLDQSTTCLQTPPCGMQPHNSLVCEAERLSHRHSGFSENSGVLALQQPVDAQAKKFTFLNTAHLVPTQKLILFTHKNTGKHYLIPESQFEDESNNLRFVEVSHSSNLSPFDSNPPVLELGPSIIDVNQFLNIPEKKKVEVSPPKESSPETNVIQTNSSDPKITSKYFQCSPSSQTNEDMTNSLQVKPTLAEALKSLKHSNSDSSIHELKTPDTSVADMESSANAEISTFEPQSDAFVDYLQQLPVMEDNTSCVNTSQKTQDEESIQETEQRIASLVPDSMKDFVRDIFEDEDALERDYIQHIMEDTVPGTSTYALDDVPQPLLKFIVRNHDPNAPAEQWNGESPALNLDEKMTSDISVQIDDAQSIIVDGIKKWQCPQCPKIFSHKHPLISHVLKHCGIKPYMCSLCGRFFTQVSHLYAHKLTHKDTKGHVCDVCGKQFAQTSHLKRHSIVHLARKPYVCDICHVGFAETNELRDHVFSAHKSDISSNQCDQCVQTFNSPKKLKIHKSTVHKRDVDLTCKDCGKVFVYPSQLRDHLQKHGGVRPFICTECGMDFLKEHHLRAHSLIHTGLQPFECDICGRKFNQKANLHRHMFIHQEEKRFKCNVCDRTFTQPQVLKAHVQTHEGKKPFQCKECGKEFSRQHNLKGHMTLHKGEKKYSCYCGLAFTLKGNLGRHKRNKHGDMSDMSDEPSQEDCALSAEKAAEILHEMSVKHSKNQNAKDEEEASKDFTTVDDTELFPPKKKRKSVPPRKALSKELLLKENNDSLPDSDEAEGQQEAIGTNTQRAKSVKLQESSSKRRKNKAVVKNKVKFIQSTETEDEVEREWQGDATNDAVPEDST